MHQLFSKKEDGAGVTTWLVLALNLPWVKIMGVLSVCFQWEEEGDLYWFPNAQT